MGTAKTSRQILEDAIAADFEDRSAHFAYADLLMEEGDPRGEYIHLRLRLEDENQPATLLQEWREQAADLYREYEEEWLGALAPFLLGTRRSVPDPVAPNIEFTFRRGWISELYVQDVRDAFILVLAKAHSSRMLQQLVLRNTLLLLHNNRNTLEPLLDSPYIGALRHFDLGDPGIMGNSAHGHLVVELIQKTPHLETLRLRATQLEAKELFKLPLPRLTHFQMEFSDVPSLRLLANNSSLTNLQTLFLDPRVGYRTSELVSNMENPEILLGDIQEVDPAQQTVFFDSAEMDYFFASPNLKNITDLTIRLDRFGDNGCRALAESGLLRRLQKLDLRNCSITDEGARLLCQNSNISRLQWLDVGMNHLTDLGVEELQRSVLRVQYDSQFMDLPYYEDPRTEDGIDGFA